MPPIGTASVWPPGGTYAVTTKGATAKVIPMLNQHTASRITTDSGHLALLNDGSNQISSEQSPKNAYARIIVHKYEMPCITRTKPIRILSTNALREKSRTGGVS